MKSVDDQPAGSASRVTVGLPVYNDPRGLRTSIPTVFAQSWTGPIRLIVIDDGSTDETPSVLAELGDYYDGIEVIRNERNRGRPVARNQILEAAGDDLLAWIDSDDLWLPRKLEFQITALAEAERTGGAGVLCTAPFRWVYADRQQERVKTPVVEGDQLYNALVGSLHPYLWAQLGRAETYRAAGGFDERLARRQDYEFFIRFLAGGGRVVSTAPDIPLCTYLKTDVGRSAAEVAAANAVIEQKHQAVYRRYGRRFALQGRQKHQQLVARFHAHNGAIGRSWIARARARALDPLLWAWRPGELLPAAKASYWRGRRAAFRARRHLLRLLRTMRTARRRALRGGQRQARRVAEQLSRQLGRGSGRPVNTLAQRQVREQVGSWRPTLPTEEVIVRTRSLLERSADVDAVAIWLDLERGYRSDGRLWSARQALDAGRAHDPDHPALAMRSIELLALDRAWQQCVTDWEASTTDSRAEARAITYARVARAYRQLGSPQAAREVAQEGLQRFPDDDRVITELRRARAVTTRWSEVAVPSAHEATVGEVTSPGFLSGMPEPLRGSLPTDADLESPIVLLLNGEPIARTYAAPTADERQPSFSMNCAQVNEFLGDEDVIELRHAGRPIAVAGGGTALRFMPGFPSQASEVMERVARGHTFNKFGQLRSGNTITRKRAILDLYGQIEELLADRLSLTCFPFYGNLLGAVREHDFLGHDVGGFDAGYLSPERNPTEVRAHLLTVCEVLLEAGYHLTVEPWSVMIRERQGEELFIDLNFAWVGDHGGLQLSYGWRYEPVTDIDWFRAERWVALADRSVRIPGNAEAVLGQLYGSGWLVPDQGFQLEVGLQRDERFLLTTQELEALRAAHPDQVRVRPTTEDDE